MSIIGFFGIASSADAAKTLDVSPASYDFGDIVVGQEYAFYYDYLEVASEDEEDLVTVSEIALTGTDADQFEINADSCIGEVGADWMGCYIEVKLIPDSAGAKSASVVITSDAVDDPITIPLTGNAVDPAANPPALAPETVSGPLTGASEIVGMSAADFDEDGRSDLFATYVMDDWPIWAATSYGQADGTLSEPVGSQFSAGGFGGGTGVGDFNGDGFPDAVAGASGGAEIYLNDGEGGLVDSGSVTSESFSGPQFTIGDYDEDDDTDFTIWGYGTAEVYLGNGDGTFAEPLTQDIGNVDPMSVAAGDLQGDGSSDVAVSDYDGQVVTYFSDGDGTFTRKQQIRPGGCRCMSPWGLDLNDINGDGKDDITVGIRFENLLYTYLSNPDDLYTLGQALAIPGYNYGYGPNPIAVDTGDLNGDGIPDAVTADYLQDTGSIFTGLATRSGYAFAGQTSLPPIDDQSFSPNNVQIADYNGDAKPDVAIGGQMAAISTYINEGEPAPAVDPESVDFGEREVGASGDPETVTITNEAEDGRAPLLVGQIDVTGDDAAQFSPNGDACHDGLLLVGQSCEIEVAFSPASSGGKTATLSVGLGGFDDPIQVPLAGTGVNVPVTPGIAVQPASLEFGSLEIGSESAAKNVTITSNGSGPLAVQSVTLGGAAAGDYALASANPCPASMAPGTTCQVPVRFKPTAAGSRSATLTVTSDAAGSPPAVSLSGTATTEPVPPPKAPVVTFKKKPKKKYVIKAKKLKKVKVAFKANQSGVKFQCRIDKKKFAGCKSPKVFKNIKPGKHVIKVRAKKDGKTGPAKAVKFKVVRKK